MDVSLMISVTSLLVSVMAIISSYFINKKVDSDNTKRKEFNLLIEPILEYLEQMEECCHNQGNHFFAPMLWDDRIAKIKRRITARQVKKLDKLLHQYLLTYNTASSCRDTDSCKALVKCSKNLRQYLRIK